MRWVPHAAIRPHRCAVIPFMGNSNSRGFIDTGQDLSGWDPHVYVSVEAVEQMARMIGWQPAHVQQGLQSQLGRLREQLTEAEGRERALQGQIDAVATLKQAGYTSARKPGRPPKERTAA